MRDGGLSCLGTFLTLVHLDLHDTRSVAGSGTTMLTDVAEQGPDRCVAIDADTIETLGACPLTNRWEVREDQSMQLERFADRLDPKTYETDDEVAGLFESDPGEPDALWCSGRLFRRLTGIASAYELHTLPLLNGSSDVRLNRSQCLSLLDEIAFVAERVNDALLVGVAQSVSDYVAARVRRPRWLGTIAFSFD